MYGSFYMNFIKQMKKREFIEMGLKTLTAILIAFLVIILMEGMIYSIRLNALKNMQIEGGLPYDNQSSIAYCIKDTQMEDSYFIVIKKVDLETNKTQWISDKTLRKTKAECLKMGSGVKELNMHAPNAFDLTINGKHFIFIGIFVVAVLGFFTYKFIMLNNAYKKTEEEFKKTGKIEVTSV